MALQLEDSWTTNDNQSAFYDNEWGGQTFRASSAYSIKAVEILAYRVNSPGTVTIAIYATSAGEPTGSALVSGTVNGNNFSTSSPGNWEQVEFSSAYALSSGTKYAIVCHTELPSGTGYVMWRRDNNAGYSDGDRVSSGDSGSTWSITTTRDMTFKTYSEDTPTGWTGKINGVTDPAKVNAVAVADISKINGVA